MVAIKDLVALSNDSACTSSDYKPSHVLKAKRVSRLRPGSAAHGSGRAGSAPSSARSIPSRSAKAARVLPEKWASRIVRRAALRKSGSARRIRQSGSSRAMRARSRAAASREMANAGELAELLSKRPEWQTQDRDQRIAAVTDFITNYPDIKVARPQLAMDTALQKPGTAYPDKPEVAKLAASMQPPGIAAFPDAEVPDLFTINRQFNWARPSGQWMNQMLKDIDAAKAAGDTATYERLTRQYTAWADQYLKPSR